MRSSAVASVWLVGSFWHILSILPYPPLLINCRPSPAFDFLQNNALVYKTYPHKQRLCPHINRGTLQMCISHTPIQPSPVSIQLGVVENSDFDV
jgi:hypothetical protein